MNKNTLFILSIMVTIILRVIFIENSSFIRDEPLFLMKAIESNQIGEWFTLGLKGKMGIHYGPIAMLYFKFLIFLSKDIFTLHLLNTFFVTFMTIVGSYFLFVRSLKLSKWLIPIVLLSPYFWFYSRNLWDNSINIPLGIMCLGFFTTFLKEKKPIYALFFTVLLNCMVQVHLMSLAFVAPILLSYLFFYRHWIIEKIKYSLGILVVNALVAFPYLKYLLSVDGLQASQGVGGSRAIFFPFFSGRVFSLFDYSYFLGKGWHKNLFTGSEFLIGPFMVVSWIAFPLVYFGLYQIFKKRNLDESNKILLIVSISTFVLHLILCFMSNLYTHPHYYNGVIALTVMLFGIGLNKLLESNIKVVSIYALSLFIGIVSIHSYVDIHGGSRKLHYGHTLKDLNTAAQKITQLKQDGVVERKTFHTEKFPEGIDTIVKLKILQGLKTEAIYSKIKLNYLNDQTNHLKIETE